MKIFISTPLRGKTKEWIEEYRRKQIAVAKRIYGEDAEIIDNFLPEKILTSHNRLYCLGISLQMLSEADVAIFPAHPESCRGTSIEYDCAGKYGIDRVILPHNLPDGE